MKKSAGPTPEELEETGKLLRSLGFKTGTEIEQEEEERLHTCVYCGDKKGPFHRDHVVPRSRGGLDTPHNLVMACAKCNRAKNDRLPSEWMTIVPAHVLEIETRVCKQVANSFKDRDRRKTFKDENEQHGVGDSRCYFCGGGFRKKSEAWLELGVQELAPFTRKPIVRFNAYGGREEVGRIAYPGSFEGKDLNWWWVAVLAHENCGPDNLYTIELSQLQSDKCIEGWKRHLYTKIWSDDVGFSLLIMDVFPDVVAFARTLK